MPEDFRFPALFPLKTKVHENGKFLAFSLKRIAGKSIRLFAQSDIQLGSLDTTI
jgi:hypothetical protein